jgi:DNA-binding LacI/PurR family transcriptional regulator
VAASSDPPLTTIRQPRERVAGAMVRLLLYPIDGKVVAPVVLATGLVTRDSA